jgi:hypothetical protein
MRFVIKIAILGLALVGAQRLYTQLRPGVDRLRGRVGTEVGGALDTVKSAASDVGQDLKIAAMQVQDDVAASVRDLGDLVEDRDTSSQVG